MNAGPFRVVAGGRDEDRYGRKLRTIERNGRSLGLTLHAGTRAHTGRLSRDTDVNYFATATKAG